MCKGYDLGPTAPIPWRAKKLRGTQLPCITVREAHYTRVLNAVLGSKTDWWCKLLLPAAAASAADIDSIGTPLTTASAGPAAPAAATTVANRWRAEAAAALEDMDLAYDLAWRYGRIDCNSSESLAAVRARTGWRGRGCDGPCGQINFPGRRFACRTCPTRFDLCATCFADPAVPHDPTHTFAALRLPIEFPETEEDARESARAAAEFMIEELTDIAARAMLRYATPRCADEAVAWPTASHGVIVSDNAVPEALRRRIADLAEPLVANSLEAGRWHPGSDRQVLDLVHPSDYPLCFRRTLFSSTPGAIVGDSVAYSQKPARHPSRYGMRHVGTHDDADVSGSFVWLPSEFRVAADGTVAIESYLNNLDEKEHPELVQVIAEVFERILPMLECAIGSAQAEPNGRRQGASYSESSFTEETKGWKPSEDFIRKHVFLSTRFGSATTPPEMLAAGTSEWIPERYLAEYEHMHRAVNVPRFPSEYHGSPISLHPQSLKNRTLQVVVKMSEIRLTPEKPSYSGGKWHLEGMYNEAIAATVLVYYNLDNIADSRVTFRHVYRVPRFQSENDRHLGLEKVYGFEVNAPELPSKGTRVTVTGDVRAAQGRAVAFPNFHQHRLEPFALADESRPGRRAVLAFFVVDPAVRIASTRDVPRQQRTLATRELSAALLDRLPLEVVGEIVKAAGATLSEAEAESVAQLVMLERSSGEVGGFADAYGISLCEH
ncbi:hypothetical protein DFJ73DRAFT_801799 [Zopfochytrium polystomum]|nr:hypothetical protein DFJ73DRAFT_801799 [Zopfochytrium polystomum]